MTTTAETAQVALPGGAQRAQSHRSRENANENFLQAWYRGVVGRKSASLPISELEWVPLERLRPGDNPRKFFPEIVKLAGLIEASGRVDRLTIDTDGNIISGERRWRAARLLNENAKKTKKEIPWPELPCEIIEASPEAKDWAVQANLGREDFRFIELARIFQAYRESGLDNKAIGDKTGYAEETVSRYISILEKTNPEIIARLDNGELIPVDLLINIYRIRDKEVQKLRLEQWLGNPVTENAAKPQRERRAMLSRRKLMALIKVLQQSEASKETVEVALYIAGLRDTLPHKWHQKLSRRLPREAPALRA